MSALFLTPGEFMSIRDEEHRRSRYGEIPPDMAEFVRMIVGPSRFSEAAVAGTVELVVDWSADSRPFGKPFGTWPFGAPNKDNPGWSLARRTPHKEPTR